MPTVVQLSNNDDSDAYTASLNVPVGEIATLYLRAEVGGELLQNEFFIDHMQSVVGYLYSSLDNRVIGYVMSDSPVTTLLAADNTSYEFDGYYSVNQATHVITDGEGEARGEFYSEAGINARVDRSSLRWFVNKGGEWFKLPTDLTQRSEGMNIGARCDYAGDGGVSVPITSIRDRYGIKWTILPQDFCRQVAWQSRPGRIPPSRAVNPHRTCFPTGLVAHPYVPN